MYFRVDNRDPVGDLLHAPNATKFPHGISRPRLAKMQRFIVFADVMPEGNMGQLIYVSYHHQGGCWLAIASYISRSAGTPLGFFLLVNFRDWPIVLWK